MPKLVWTVWIGETSLAPARNLTHAIQAIAHCYSDRAILASTFIKDMESKELDCRLDD